MSEFIVSKRIKNVVEFDKTNKKLRFLLDDGDQDVYKRQPFEHHTKYAGIRL